MREKKHIDRLFQEEFKDFEVSPKERVWKNIEKELKPKRRRSFLVPFWYRIAGAAALVALIFSIGNFLSGPGGAVGTHPSDPAVVDGKPVPAQDDMLKNDVRREGTEQQKTTPVEKENPVQLEAAKTGIVFTENEKIENPDSSGKNETIEQAEPKFVSTSPTKLTGSEKTNAAVGGTSNSEKSKTEQNRKQITTGIGVVQMNNKSKTDPQKNSLFDTETFTGKQEINPEPLSPTKSKLDETLKKETEKAEGNKKSLLAIAEEKQQKEENPDDRIKNPEQEQKKWEIRPFAAPIYYDGFGSENALDPSLAQNKSKGEVTMSYGVNFSYKISEHLKIRSGISQVSMGHNTENIAFAPAVKPIAINNISYSNEADNLTIVNGATLVNATSSELLGRVPYTSGTLHQQLGFLEIPMELEYQLVNNQFGVSIIGGASTLLLNENNLVIRSENGTTNVGKMKNLNDMSFSANVGIGLKYEVFKQFEINLEPTFKYQINTFNNNDNGFKPYYFGVYTGVGFQF